MIKPKKIIMPYHRQNNIYYCGPASLQMVFEYFKTWKPQDVLARQAHTTSEEGTKNQDMIAVAVKNGFYCYVNNNSTFFEIRHFLEKGLPIIVDYIEPSDNETHFAVVSGITRRYIVLNDPWNGKNFKLLHKDFLERWHDKKNKHKEWIMVLAQEDFQLGKQYIPDEPKK